MFIFARDMIANKIRLSDMTENDWPVMPEAKGTSLSLGKHLLRHTVLVEINSHNKSKHHHKSVRLTAYFSN